MCLVTDLQFAGLYHFNIIQGDSKCMCSVETDFLIEILLDVENDLCYVELSLMI